MSDVLAELEHVEAIYLGQHFVYKSGKHGSGYINMDPLFPHIQLVAKLCGELAGAFLEEFDTVAAPAIGGIELSLLTALAHHNRTGQITSGVWADKVDGGRLRPSGFYRSHSPQASSGGGGFADYWRFRRAGLSAGGVPWRHCHRCWRHL
jgi:hypothetical protein